MELYDELGRICSSAYEVYPGGDIYALNIPAGAWHTLRALESGTVILEMKDGAYEPVAECIIFAEVCKFVFYYRLVHRLSIGLGALTVLGSIILSVPVGVGVCYATRWLSKFFGEDEQ